MEVLVSVLFIGIALVPLFHMQSGAIDLSGAGKFYNTASFLAQKQLAILEQNGLEQGNDKGEFGSDHSGYKWKSRITPIELDSPWDQPDDGVDILKKIELEISNSASRVYRLTTARYTYE